MGKMNDVIMMARSAGASDIHISEGRPLQIRVNGKLMKAEMQPEPGSIRQVILEMLDGEKLDRLGLGEDLDFAVATPDGNRQRVNVFRYQGKLAATIRAAERENSESGRAQAAKSLKGTARSAERPDSCDRSHRQW